jgi:hypothetical protein
MEADSFDTLTRFLIATGSRRRTLAAALAGALGLLGLARPDHAAAARSGKCKPKCTECATCKRGKCHKTKHGKTCRKGKCQAKANGTACSSGTCQGGICTAAGTCTAAQEDLCQEQDFAAANCNGTTGCSCYTTTHNTRFCGRDLSAYCPTGGCADDADCPGTEACAQVLMDCGGCPPSDVTFCVALCGP